MCGPGDRRNESETGHTDFYQDDEQSHTDHTDQYNDDEEEGDDGDLKPATYDGDRHSKDRELQHPTENVEELSKTWHLQKQLRDANLIDTQGFDERSESQEEAIEISFDKTVIESAPLALRASGWDIETEDVPIEEGYLLALVLRKVRFCGFRELKAHLEEFDMIRDTLDIRGYSKSAFSSRNTDLRDYQRDAVEEAATRVLYAIYRSGEPFPSEVWQAHEEKRPDHSPVALEQAVAEEGLEIPKPRRDEGIRNWAEEFIECGILEELSFGRDEENTIYPLESFIGLLAHAALQNTTINGATKSCAGWVADYELVPWGSGISGQLDKFSMTEVSEMLWEANKRFLEYAGQYVPYSTSMRLAFDDTDVPLDPVWEGDKWTKGYAATLHGDVESTEEEEKWSVAVLGLMESDARFVQGVLPMEKREGTQAAALSRLLRPTVTESPVSPKLVIMDRGMVGAKLVTRLRELVGRDWVILGKKEHEPGRLVEQTPEGETEFYPEIDYLKDLSERPNAFVMPIHEDEERATDTQRVFLTDLTEDEIEFDELNFKYKHRNRIETTIGQIKSDFDIRLNRSGSSKTKLYYVGIGMLFFNLHNLINNSLSPEYALPLGDQKHSVTANEVLSGIREVAFAKASEKID